VNLADVLFASAGRQAERVAVTDVRSGRSLTYGALARESERVAAFLRAQGVEPGQRIGLLSPNGLEYLPAAFGLLSTGACLVPLATNLAPPEMRQLLGDVAVNGCLASPDADALPGPGRRRALTSVACDGFTFEWVDRRIEGPGELRDIQPAFIRFTSGTTARSKGVVLSHAATLARVQAADAVLGFTPDDRILWVLPLAYHFAVTIVAYVKAGAHILMCPDTLPRSVVHAIRRAEATVFYASPFHFERLGNLGPTGPLKSVRLALSTSAPITEPVMARFEELYGVPVAQAYGIIEAGLPCINARTDGLPATSVGRAVPGYEIAVFSDAGERLGSGALGEIGVRGTGLFSAYYAPWQRVEHVMRDGWFMTGDIGWLDERGALYLRGRTKAVIFVAGLKFFPEEIEDCINRFPGIVESRVSGGAHPRLGQVPRAEIVIAASGCDVEALRAHCVRALSAYKVPVAFDIVPAIAKTPGGKILRR
jgi:acyl-CoA synthetase (AMP-forming)/AMP-acid ligase II